MRTLVLSALMALAPINAQALPFDSANDLYVRVIDTGQGLATVTSSPGGHYLVYDAGVPNEKTVVMRGIADVVPADATIDLMVLSHSDADHLGAAAAILSKYKVKRVLHGGQVRTTATYTAFASAFKTAVEAGTEDINLATANFPFGSSIDIGSAKLTMVIGYHKAPDDWGLINDSEINNAISIVARLDFAGHSILFAGDDVGRHLDSPPNSLIAEEKVMVENAGTIPIKADALVAPHHGADNGSSEAFIRAVAPSCVVFSAGVGFHHPRAVTANRYTDPNVGKLPKEKLFRTDLGSKEGGTEWREGNTTAGDRVGDDDVDIVITRTGQVSMGYRTEGRDQSCSK